MYGLNRKVLAALIFGFCCSLLGSIATFGSSYVDDHGNGWPFCLNLESEWLNNLRPFDEQSLSKYKSTRELLELVC